MAIGRPLSPLTVSAEQREQLQSWSRRAKTAQALALRPRIVLLGAEGLANKEIARRQGCSQPTAGKWRQRFLDFGVDGLLDEPRPGTPRKLSDQEVERVLTRTLESQLEAATHWSTRDMAKACGLSQSSISPILARFFRCPASFRHLQAQPRSPLHREGARHRRPLSCAAGPGAGAVRSIATCCSIVKMGLTIRRGQPRGVGPLLPAPNQAEQVDQSPSALNFKIRRDEYPEDHQGAVVSLGGVCGEFVQCA